jgi:Fe-S oxidoreductase
LLHPERLLKHRQPAFLNVVIGHSRMNRILNIECVNPRVTGRAGVESEIYCGSAGTYNLTEPEMAQRLLKRKITNIAATGTDLVVT